MRMTSKIKVGFMAPLPSIYWGLLKPRKISCQLCSLKDIDLEANMSLLLLFPHPEEINALSNEKMQPP